jgi:hypothetical protein
MARSKNGAAEVVETVNVRRTVGRRRYLSTGRPVASSSPLERSKEVRSIDRAAGDAWRRLLNSSEE